MAFASLSILGLYEWNTDVFDNLVLPDGMDEDILIPEIVTQCSDFPLLYPNYEFMKMLIGVWSQKELHIWDKLYQTELVDFNPAENYDRYEEISRTAESSSESSSESSNSTTDSSNGSSTASATAYNSLTFKDANKTTSTGASTGSATGSDSSESSSDGSEHIVGRMHGNIGTMTFDQILDGSRRAYQFCTYDYIVDSFKMRFCIQVY